MHYRTRAVNVAPRDASRERGVCVCPVRQGYTPLTEVINKQNENPIYLPGIPLPTSIKAQPDIKVSHCAAASQSAWSVSSVSSASVAAWTPYRGRLTVASGYYPVRRPAPC